jgi:hypothetical protein
MLSLKAAQEILRAVNWSDIPKAVAFGCFPIPNTPAAKWSLCNRVISICGGSLDYRGVGQWRKINRYLQKGCKPIYIVCPQLHQEMPENEPRKVLDGFIGVPVYPVSQTYGDPVEYSEPPHKVMDMRAISDKWKVSSDGINWRYQVSTCFDEIEELAWESEKEFVWQTCHEAYSEIFEDHKNRKDRLLVMEIASLTMLYIIGRRVTYNGRHLSMIQRYGQEMKLSSLAAFLSIIKIVEILLNRIFEVGMTN